jgi:hypothetical protein
MYQNDLAMLNTPLYSLHLRLYVLALIQQYRMSSPVSTLDMSHCNDNHDKEKKHLSDDATVVATESWQVSCFSAWICP